MNQCDGCRRGLKLVDGLHRDTNDMPVMGCTADRYDEPDEGACTHPNDHEFVCTGTAYGGDDERWHGEGRSLCIHCGADGDG